MSFADEIKQAERDGAVSGGAFKPQEGANRLRIVDGPLRDEVEFKEGKKVRWFVLIIDRADGIVKTWSMPHSIAKMIRDLQQSEDYGFERTPLPYDVTLTAKGAGTIDVEYSVMPAKKETPLTDEELVAIALKGNLADLHRRLNANRRAKPVADDSEIPT